MTRRLAHGIWTLIVTGLLATTASAQPIQKEVVETSFTGRITALDVGAGTIQVEGANGEKGTFHVDDAATTILSSDEKVGMSALHAGEWISIDADTRKGKRVATYIEVVEDPGGDEKSSDMATAAGATVEVRHNKLSPAVVQLRAGQSVTFHNLDKMPGGHTVMATDGSFSSPPLDKDQSWSHSFDVPGIYPVRIKEHPSAEASIVVEAAD